MVPAFACLAFIWTVSYGNFWVAINKRCSKYPWNFWGLESQHSKSPGTDKHSRMGTSLLGPENRMSHVLHCSCISLTSCSGTNMPHWTMFCHHLSKPSTTEVVRTVHPVLTFVCLKEEPRPFLMCISEQMDLSSFLVSGFLLICLVVGLVSRFSGLSIRDPKSFRLSWEASQEMILWKRVWKNKLRILASSRKTLC